MRTILRVLGFERQTLYFISYVKLCQQDKKPKRIGNCTAYINDSIAPDDLARQVTEELYTQIGCAEINTTVYALSMCEISSRWVWRRNKENR